MISLYLHIPFCRQKCLYCSFYSLTDFDKSEYIDAIIRCVQYFGKKSGANAAVSDYRADTVYIGGGTPSVLPPELLYRLFDAVYRNFDIEKNAEITVEANPESCGSEFLYAAKSMGVNRLSLGVQSFDDKELRAVGRVHTAAQAAEAVTLARRAGFNNISCDLIFGLPGQTDKSFENSLKTLAGLDIEHISCYNLQVEDGTPLKKAGVLVPGEEQQEKMYFLACEFLADRGYGHYEISNYAKRGFESRHNSAYWMGKDYLGLGPAAHSKIGDMRCSFLPDIERFCLKDDFEFDISEQIDDPLFEKIMLSLRTKTGIDASLLKNSGKFIVCLIESGYAVVENGILRLTDRGFYLSNSIIAELAAREC